MTVKNELASAVRTHVEKLIYFKLGASGACIAYAMSLTDAIPLRFPHILILMALISWGGSFLTGHRALKALEGIIQTNYNFVDMGEQVPPELHPDLKDFIGSTEFVPRQRRLDWWSGVQTFLLVLGAALVFAWRVAMAYQ